MKELFLNVLIVLLVGCVIYFMRDPLALLALTLMLPIPQDSMQRGFSSMSGDMDFDEESRPIGFTADLVA
jgi:hypothetical protein